jgi:hypothetical protein
MTRPKPDRACVQLSVPREEAYVVAAVLKIAADRFHLWASDVSAPHPPDLREEWRGHADCLYALVESLQGDIQLGPLTDPEGDEHP